MAQGNHLAQTVDLLIPCRINRLYKPFRNVSSISWVIKKYAPNPNREIEKYTQKYYNIRIKGKNSAASHLINDLRLMMKATVFSGGGNENDRDLCV
ncbi:MAG: hypothetical protein NUV45_00050 [Tepidanaerobacteraceae bacterium]|jgi:hypothetical protein|nr:hypothetical protein [Tepidanaerobacteraceae bacterium]